MKGTITVLAALLIFGVSQAQAFSSITAQKACSRISFSEGRECEQTVKSGYFDGYALDFCTSSLRFSDGQLSCVKYIENKTFSIDSLNYCDRQANFDDDLLNCLKKSEYKTRDRSNIPETIVPSNIAQVCGSLKDQKEACYQAAQGKVFSDEALGLCNVLTYVSTTLKCVQAIADKEYKTNDINACNSQNYTDASVVSCLTAVGTSSDDEESNGRCPSYQNIQNRIDKASNALKNDNIRRVERILDRLSRSLQDCP